MRWFVLEQTFNLTKECGEVGSIPLIRPILTEQLLCCARLESDSALKKKEVVQTLVKLLVAG